MPPQPTTTTRARTAVAKRDETGVAKRTDTILDVIKAQRAELARALPAHMSSERFLRAVLTVCKSTPALLDCTPKSFLGAMMLSAQLGLEPGPLGHAYYVPFKNNKTNQREVQFIPGYKGLIDLARRSGHIASIYAHPVFEGDRFHFMLGLAPDIKHEPTSPHAERTDPTKVTHVYAVARFRDAGSEPVFVVLTRAQVDAAKARSKASGNGPWVTDWTAMALKTAVRRLCTWLPLSVELATAVEADERVVDVDSDQGFIFDLDAEAIEDAAVVADPQTGEIPDGPSSPEQQVAIDRMCRVLRWDTPQRRGFAAWIAGRPIGSITELTVVEASLVIEALDDPLQRQDYEADEIALDAAAAQPAGDGSDGGPAEGDGASAGTADQPELGAQ